MLAVRIQDAAGHDNVVSKLCHPFQVARTDGHTLLQHVFAVMGCDYELHVLFSFPWRIRP